MRSFWIGLVLSFSSLALAQNVPEPAPFDLEAAMRVGPPLTEDRAVELALHAAPSAEQARANARAAQAAVSVARVAMVPRLELTARYAHIDGFPDSQISLGGDPAATAAARMLAMQVADPAARQLFLGQLDSMQGGATIHIPRDQVSFGARLTFPVSDLFFAMWPALESSEAIARAQDRRTDAALNDVRMAARESYLRLAQARGSNAVATQALAQAQTQLADVEAAHRAGYMTQADELAARARVASSEQFVASTDAAVALADAALRMLTAEEADEAYGIAQPLLDVEVADPGPLALLTDRAIASRPEMDALRDTVAAQHAAGRASDARGYPHVALYAAGDVSNPSPRMIPPQQVFQPAWEVGVTLTWSPNDTWTAVHQGEQLSAQVAVLEAQRDQLERAVRLEVRQSVEQMRAARRGVEAAHTALDAAQAAYDSRVAQVHAGAATNADLTAAAVQLDQARLSLLSATIDLHLARAHLSHAIGE
jgi:outer membrane protein TolC